MAGLYDVGNTCDSFVCSLSPFLLQGKTTPGSSSSLTHIKLKSLYGIHGTMKVDTLDLIGNTLKLFTLG
jgi:hypothetical protein